MRLLTGRSKYQKHNKTANKKAEKHMRICQKILEKDKQEYDKHQNWKRIDRI